MSSTDPTSPIGRQPTLFSPSHSSSTDGSDGLAAAESLSDVSSLGTSELDGYDLLNDVVLPYDADVNADAGADGTQSIVIVDTPPRPPGGAEKRSSPSLLDAMPSQGEYDDDEGVSHHGPLSEASPSPLGMSYSTVGATACSSFGQATIDRLALPQHQAGQFNSCPSCPPLDESWMTESIVVRPSSSPTVSMTNSKVQRPSSTLSSRRTEPHGVQPTGICPSTSQPDESGSTAREASYWWLFRNTTANVSSSTVRTISAPAPVHDDPTRPSISLIPSTDPKSGSLPTPADQSPGRPASATNDYPRTSFGYRFEEEFASYNRQRAPTQRTSTKRIRTQPRTMTNQRAPHVNGANTFGGWVLALLLFPLIGLMLRCWVTTPTISSLTTKWVHPKTDRGIWAQDDPSDSDSLALDPPSQVAWEPVHGHDHGTEPTLATKLSPILSEEQLLAELRDLLGKTHLTSDATLKPLSDVLDRFMELEKLSDSRDARSEWEKDWDLDHDLQEATDWTSSALTTDQQRSVLDCAYPVFPLVHT